MKRLFNEIFATKTQLEWTEIFDSSDACVTPVLSFKDLIPNSSTSRDDNKQAWPRKAAMPQPAPLLSRTPATTVANTTQDNPFLEPGKHSIEILKEFGIGSNDIEGLLQAGVIVDSSSSNHSKARL